MKITFEEKLESLTVYHYGNVEINNKEYPFTIIVQDDNYIPIFVQWVEDTPLISINEREILETRIIDELRSKEEESEYI